MSHRAQQDAIACCIRELSVSDPAASHGYLRVCSMLSKSFAMVPPASVPI